MKHLFRSLIFAIVVLFANSAMAVYVEKMPINQIQPNGDTIHIFVTGDEFYHRYHDNENFTIVQNQAGYWVYATSDKAGGVAPTQYLVNTVDPKTLGLVPGLSISSKKYQALRKQWEIPEAYRASVNKTSGRNHGDFCNLVIFIRFADDTVYTRPLSSVDHMFNDSSSNTTVSLYNYFKKASYNKIFIHTYYAPEPDGNTILSYQDSHPRAYYMPYNDNNPIGYTGYSDRTEREFDLLENAVNWINANSPVSTAYNLDCNDDGDIDNINFVVKGTYTGWNDLLWPHKFNLYSRQVFINGKRVNTFNLALEGAGDDYFGTSTFCHEMFHSLGAPDLYHYNSDTEISPIGSWDLMATNQKPPQHSTAWIKYRYGNWLDSIPLITTPGQYTLTSVADSIPGTMALRFPSARPHEFYVVEYRDNTELFETKLPGKGLIIYRINELESGNASWDGFSGNEIWVFRPGSTNDGEQGAISNAYFSPASHRTEFSPSTPESFPFLSDGTRDYTFAITNIGTPGNTCTFRYTNHTTPASLRNTRITSNTAILNWEGVGEAYRLSYRKADSDVEYTTRLVFTKSATLYGLETNAKYEWRVRSLYDATSANTFADSSANSASLTFHTERCNNSSIDTVGWYTDNESTGVPYISNQKYNYAQIIYTAAELSEAKSISTINLHYAHTTPLSKANCTIYMGNTTVTDFNNEHSQAIPLSELTPVFSGDLTFNKGWNEIILDNTFDYNGTDNLVIAIDDNSGEPSRAGNKFYGHNTSDRMCLVYSSNDNNPDPAQDSVTGSRSRQLFRPNIKITGCPIDPTHAYICVLSNNENLGNVSGEGLYDLNTEVTLQAFPRSGIQFLGWNDGNADNPRTITVNSDSTFVALFHSPEGINDVNNPGLLVLTQGLNLSIQGANNQPINIYDLMGRHICGSNPSHNDTATFQLPHPGIYLIRVGSDKPIKILVR